MYSLVNNLIPVGLDLILLEVLKSSFATTSPSLSTGDLFRDRTDGTHVAILETLVMSSCSSQKVDSFVD